MTYLVRKYSRGKWPKEDFDKCPVEALRADAITSCLRTTNDTLSTWEIESLENVEDAVLALVSGFDKLATVDVLIFSINEVEKRGFKVELTPGDTPIEELKNTHMDITGLTYKTVGEFSRLMLDTMNVDGRTMRFTVKKLKTLFQEAIDKGKVDVTLLKERLRLEVTENKAS
ncbi:hypothetical protein MHZ92_07795 [Sporosarcina sp. ACRSL]|uniref:hypothetical protein n=1 Tax=Sporosarcina sp. ACRSL TaxID=2918215 RepID=UPI001EF5B205|nr:hypothetical protein [Sporosarcina sp. ACRSL]MCG7344030.1 hypothetical protein [Sporosarcina sp. ACRSL]